MRYALSVVCLKEVFNRSCLCFGRSFCGSFCGSISRSLCSFSFSLCGSLGSFLLLGHGEEHGGGRKRDSIVSDAMESVIAASYMDGGFSAAKEIIDRLILCDVPAGKPHNFDYKTALQELVQRKKDQVLCYELIGESGPDHDKKFEVEVLLNGKPCGKGSGSSKKRAEQAAAAAAIDALFPGEL